jgi:hypothetical protein
MTACRQLAKVAAITTVLLAVPMLPSPLSAQTSRSEEIYNEAADNTCEKASFCVVLFKLVPANKTLIVRHVTCRTRLFSEKPSYYLEHFTLQYAKFGISKMYQFATGTKFTETPASKGYILNNTVLLKAPAPGQVRVKAQISATMDVIESECSIAGEVIPGF